MPGRWFNKSRDFIRAVGANGPHCTKFPCGEPVGRLNLGSRRCDAWSKLSTRNQAPFLDSSRLCSRKAGCLDYKKRSLPVVVLRGGLEEPVLGMHVSAQHQMNDAARAPRPRALRRTLVQSDSGKCP